MIIQYPIVIKHQIVIPISKNMKIFNKYTISIIKRNQLIVQYPTCIPISISIQYQTRIQSQKAYNIKCFKKKNTQYRIIIQYLQ